MAYLLYMMSGSQPRWLKQLDMAEMICLGPPFFLPVTRIAWFFSTLLLQALAPGLGCLTQLGARWQLHFHFSLST